MTVSAMDPPNDFPCRVKSRDHSESVFIDDETAHTEVADWSDAEGFLRCFKPFDEKLV